MMASQPLPTIGEDDLLEIDFALEDHLLATRANGLAHLCFVHFDLDDEEEEEEEEKDDEEDEGEGCYADNDHELVRVAEDATTSGLAPLEVSTATSLPPPPPTVHVQTDTPHSAQSESPSPTRSNPSVLAARLYHDGTIKEGVGVLTRRRERLAGKSRTFRPP